MIDYALAGLLQGLLEWLPVSSSGQVMIALSLALGLPPSSAYRIALALHIGTLVSAIIYYRREVLSGLLALHKWRDNIIARIWLFSTPVSILIGFPLFKLYEGVAGSIPQDWIMMFIGVPLVVVVGLLGVKMKGGSWKDQPTNIDLFLLGVVQGFSVIPGISRSGVTIAFLLIRGVNPLSSVKTSFLAGIPVIGAAALYTMVFEGAFNNSGDAIIGGIAALIGGLVGIWLVELLAKKFNQYVFTLIIGLILVCVGVYSLI